MPIRPPALDDRSYDDLVAELIARIPAHTPEWTHPVPGDPGRTLIELFAWLGDTILYRANLIPERQRLAFLRLLGMPLTPAHPACGLVALEIDAQPPLRALDVLPGALIDKPLPFTTASYVTAYPVLGRCFIKRRLDTAEKSAFAQLLPDLAAAYRLDAAQQPVGYRTQEVFTGGAASAGGVDIVGDSVDGALWIALLAPQEKWLAEARATLGPDSGGAPRALNLGLAPAQELPGVDEAVGARARVPLRYELSVDPAQVAAGLPPRVALDVLADGTDGLARSGVVRLGLPALALIGAASNDPQLNPQAGLGDAPPRLEAPEDGARLIAWLRLAPASGTVVERLRLSWAGLHATDVVQRRPLPPRVLGTSDGGSDQSFDLGIAGLGSADAARLRIDVLDPLFGDQRYVALDDLGRAGPLDAVYRLDAEAGTVSFGDGVHGRVPSAGSSVVARELFVGGGAAGNLPAGTLAAIASLPDPAGGAAARPAKKLALRQPLALAGGADAETLDAAERRIPAYFQHRDRAVTAFDYRRLAHEAPGSEVARVELLPRFKPHERLTDVPGVVSVMVWPPRAADGWRAPYPRADRPLLEAVHAHLDARRPLATELYAIGCAYKPLGVAVAVQIADGHVRETVLRSVRDALQLYLWPLPSAAGAAHWPPGQTRDGGYPLGRGLSDRELEVVTARVDGVAGVSPVRLFERSAGGTWTELPGIGKAVTRFDLEAWELPELLALAVTEGIDAPASPLGAAEDDGGAGSEAVFVPTVPETC